MDLKREGGGLIQTIVTYILCVKNIIEMMKIKEHLGTGANMKKKFLLLVQLSFFLVKGIGSQLNDSGKQILRH